jgi:hypothetical protein
MWKSIGFAVAGVPGERVVGFSERLEPAHACGLRIRPYGTKTPDDKEVNMATPERRYGPGTGITLGGIIVIAGIVIWLLFDAPIVGIILILVGLLAFGGFARGRWY